MSLPIEGIESPAFPTRALAVAAAVLALGLVLAPPSPPDVASLRSWTPLVAYAAQHPELPMPAACASLVSAHPAARPEQASGDRAELARRCEAVLRELATSGRHQLALTPALGWVQPGAVGFFVVWPSILGALLAGGALALALPWLLALWSPGAVAAIAALGGLVGGLGAALLADDPLTSLLGGATPTLSLLGALGWRLRGRTIDLQRLPMLDGVDGLPTLPAWSLAAAFATMAGLGLGMDAPLLARIGAIVGACAGGIAAASAAAPFEDDTWARALAAPAANAQRQPAAPPVAAGDASTVQHSQSAPAPAPAVEAPASADAAASEPAAEQPWPDLDGPVEPPPATVVDRERDDRIGARAADDAVDELVAMMLSVAEPPAGRGAAGTRSPAAALRLPAQLPAQLPIRAPIQAPIQAPVPEPTRAFPRHGRGGVEPLAQATVVASPRARATRPATPVATATAARPGPPAPAAQAEAPLVMELQDVAPRAAEGLADAELHPSTVALTPRDLAALESRSAAVAQAPAVATTMAYDAASRDEIRAALAERRLAAAASAETAVVAGLAAHRDVHLRERTATGYAFVLDDGSDASVRRSDVRAVVVGAVGPAGSDAVVHVADLYVERDRGIERWRLPITAVHRARLLVDADVGAAWRALLADLASEGALQLPARQVWPPNPPQRYPGVHALEAEARRAGLIPSAAAT